MPAASSAWRLTTSASPDRARSHCAWPRATPSISSACPKATSRWRAVVYLSVAPKSNALYTAYGAVLQDVEQTAPEPVPLHLRNAPTTLMKGLGYGKDYQYAHDTEKKVADVQCRADSLRNRVYYRPTNEGVEKQIRERLEEIKRLKQPRQTASTQRQVPPRAERKRSET